jgi:hypothetical protein
MPTNSAYRSDCGGAGSSPTPKVGVRAGNRLDIVGPAPARLEDPATESEASEGDHVHVPMVLEGASLVRTVDVLLVGHDPCPLSVLVVLN